MPLQRRLPKFGFKSLNKKEFQPVNLAKLQALAETGVTTIGLAEMIAAGYAKQGEMVKILGNGQLTVKVDVTAHAFSKAAEEAIKAQGGNATTL